jgi:hypothetical protein
MILNSAPVNEATLSNVSEIGEFRIRNSAKAFNILSSGLYANKVRAIIREISCNAVDSHIAANNKNRPFDVHLPNQLEPWFSVRDYGVGLSHNQVTSIYTTYFESTKTNSNDYIGALGLGSKSPFSYTDNFTVTAIKDGRKGIYSAFINDSGVPSIALMFEEETTDESGVEVKFSVNDSSDFYKFREEARTVYTFFELKPNVSGYSGFSIPGIDYVTKDIIPNVHSVRNQNSMRAIMGNIAYPVDLPSPEQNLGDLSRLISCGLELHFGIGELDFQASREGLSYIPQTINAIKKKLSAVNDQLTVFIAKEADAIKNEWDRAYFLAEKYNSSNGLWTAAVKKYIVDTKFTLLNSSGGIGVFQITTSDLQNKYNIKIAGFSKPYYEGTIRNIKPRIIAAPVTGVTDSRWDISAAKNVRFVVNKDKLGCIERVKHHFRQENSNDRREFYLIEAADKTKTMDVGAFFKDLKSPPASFILDKNDLVKKVVTRSSTGTAIKGGSILKLKKTWDGYDETTTKGAWEANGALEDYDDSETYYYIPLDGYEGISKFSKTINVKRLIDKLSEYLSGIEFDVDELYGVRKAHIDTVKGKKNWVNIEDHIVSVMKKLPTNYFDKYAITLLDFPLYFMYNADMAKKVGNGDYLKFIEKYKGCKESSRFNSSTVSYLYSTYMGKTNFQAEFNIIAENIKNEFKAVDKKYPLLKHIGTHIRDLAADYINLIDTQKGI